jgi:hypothetical protein
MKIIAKQVGSMLVFDAEKCGVTFHSIAFVYDWRSENPLIYTTKPLGMNAVYAILNEVERLKNDTTNKTSSTPNRI